MRINILTQPLFCNYGGILQNFALQNVLKKLGHDPLTINVPPTSQIRKSSLKDYVRACVNFFNRLRGVYLSPFYNPKTFYLKEHLLSFPQREFINNYINSVNESGPFSSDICERYPAEAWIVGSDQIWRPWCSFYLENCFFDFIIDPQIRKLSYAASFGSDKWEIDQKMTEKIKPLAKKFDAISVREKSGVELLRDNLGVESIDVLDPTLLLNADDYKRIINGIEMPRTPYIANYVLDMNGLKLKSIRKDSKYYNLKVFRVGKMNKDGFDSIESWIAGIANAERVITDSFHGTVFSIIFEKPVKILCNNIRGNTRLESLLSTLNLKIDNDGYYIVNDSNRKIIELERQKSIAFLINKLS